MWIGRRMPTESLLIRAVIMQGESKGFPFFYMHPMGIGRRIPIETRSGQL